MSEERIFKFKVILIGDPAVGKTSLINQYMDKQFEGDYRPTLGYQLMKKEFKLPNNMIVVISFWDIAGQEAFEMFHDIYFDNANGVILVYDVTDPETFENTLTWYSDFTKKESRKGAAGVLAGNKIDLEKKVSSEQGKKRAEELGYHFIETSALKDKNVDEAFEYILNKLLPE